MAIIEDSIRRSKTTLGGNPTKYMNKEGEKKTLRVSDGNAVGQKRSKKDSVTSAEQIPEMVKQSRRGRRDSREVRFGAYSGATYGEA